MKIIRYVLGATTIVAALALSARAADFNDAQIAAIALAANQVDIDAGELAASKGSSKEVKEFGRTMATDHAGVNKVAIDLTTKLKVTPEESWTSESVKADGKKTLERLKKLNGPEFDKAYVDNEVTFHQMVLNAVDKVLIPNATDPEINALLVKVRPAFVAHLEHAKHLQASLSNLSKATP